ncbi:NEMATODE RESISTANCE PROTEIN-LIKE HSPRO1 [Salix viminalis]|uniref:NEMATODE RESISTANCE PROTEIN-LIKE HSPRO1 n=1 Tax=Salix viminalis TaxID=40686 RepID=A0A9Q0Z419_SALVM|nr:NEMATODE RESISTANCE PROTEIN-LIKE HSPRO1 [Salix viminalis]
MKGGAIPFRGVSNISPIPASNSSCSAYEHCFRLPELRKIWDRKDFPDWKTESILKPALQALEITFRFISTVLSDARPYSNRREWTRRIESLTASQIELIAIIIEDEAEDSTTRGTAPIVDLSSSNGVLIRDGSYAEVWKVPGETTVVNKTSESSLLPRLATWQTSEDVAQKILYTIECEMRRCPYTLGLSEPNLSGKPSLAYDAVCRPNEIHALKKSPYDHINNHENQSVYNTHQILEAWIHVAKQIIQRLTERIESKEFPKAANDCYLVERIWKLLAEIEDLHLMMDPDDFLRLKKSVTNAIARRNGSDLFQIERISGDNQIVQGIEAQVKKRSSRRCFLLQAFQAIEGALKRFFYAYKQLLVVVMGSLEAKGNGVAVTSESCDSLTQLFLEPTYFPSLDAAKTFLGESSSHQQHKGTGRRSRREQ